MRKITGKGKLEKNGGLEGKSKMEKEQEERREEVKYKTR